ncbi:YesL family protein [Gracilibacillus oryzae]|uniref:YesL family protein n=1 Tax=Gracilibacillus oryzae TaxID=1672701 RepID=UPI001885CC8A|nr:DUF624 domain-containing protein [Gracilibacillus oryzae]
MINSKLYTTLETITNFILLNLIWLVVSIPVFTLFPATAAMFSVVRDWTLKKEINLLKHFFQYFRLHFTKSFILGIGFIIFVIIFFIDLSILGELDHSMSILVLSLLFLVGISVSFMGIFLFPLMIRYELTLRDLIKNSFMFSIMYYPSTLLSIILLVTVSLIVAVVPIMACMVFAPTAYIIHKICNRTFIKVSSVINEKKDDSTIASS